MVETRSQGGIVKQYTKPEWRPLLDLVGEETTQAFMWMHEVALEDGSHLHAYKNIDTRKYVHVSTGGATFTYESSGRYRRVASMLIVDAALGRPYQSSGDAPS